MAACRWDRCVFYVPGGLVAVEAGELEDGYPAGVYVQVAEGVTWWRWAGTAPAEHPEVGDSQPVGGDGQDPVVAVPVADQCGKGGGHAGAGELKGLGALCDGSVADHVGVVIDLHLAISLDRD